MRRGEIWWAALPERVGGGPGVKRPVLVVQTNPFNESRISTVIVAVITSNLSLADAPGNLCLTNDDSGLAKPSVVNVSQVLTIDRRLLVERLRVVPSQLMERINLGLRLALGL